MVEDVRLRGKHLNLALFDANLPSISRSKSVIHYDISGLHNDSNDGMCFGSGGCRHDRYLRFFPVQLGDFQSFEARLMIKTLSLLNL